MRIDDWLALALRIIGALLLIYGLQYLLDALLFYLGYFTYPDSTTGYYLISGLTYVFIGLYLLRGAPLLVRFSYPEEEADERDEESGDAEE